MFVNDNLQIYRAGNINIILFIAMLSKLMVYIECRLLFKKNYLSFINFFKENLQGYPQRKRLQKPMYGLCLICFLEFRVFYVLNYLINNQKIRLNAETNNQALNRHIFRVLGRLYCLILYEDRQNIKHN